jgi:hypothetical protein
VVRYCAFVLAVLAGVSAVVHWRWVRAMTPAQFIEDAMSAHGRLAFPPAHY